MNIVPTKKMTPADRWFVADRPVTDLAQDAFSHADVADNLRLIIEQASPDERLMIGLLGPFGVGKSTVVRLLGRKFTDPRFVVLRVSAERHELPGLHRSLIYAFAEELVEADGFDKSAVTKVLQRLEQKTSQKQTDMLAAPVFQLVRAIPGAVGLKGLLIAIAIAALLVTGVIVWASVHHWTGAALFAAITSVVALVAGSVPGFLLLGASRWLGNLTTPGEATTEIPRVESADEFERTFADLVKINTTKKLVIALDDLDRLSPGEVLQGLNAIRSFQLTCPPGQRPIFIIAADEEIIEAAIARSNPGLAAATPRPGARAESAQAFLDRLFTHRQPMPAHAVGDLTAYATRLLGPTHAGAAALGDHLQPVIDILIHDGVQDPRHVTRLLNGFFADYRLVMQRENRANGARSIARGLVTDQPEVLARITVFKVDFTPFYRALFEDEDLLHRLEAAIASTADFADEDKQDSGYGAEQASAEWTNLRNFIGRSSVLQPVSDLRPFLYLGQDELDRIIGGKEARDVRNDLVNRQFGQLQDRLAGLAGDHARLTGVTTLFGQVLRQSRSLELTNAVETLTRVLDLLPATAYPDLAVAVASAFLNGAATPQDTGPLVDLVHEARDSHIKVELATKILSTGLDPSIDRELVVLRGRTQLNEAIGSDVVTEYLAGFVSRLGSSDIHTVGRWLEALDDTPAPDLSSRILTSALRVLDGNEHDAPPSWNAPLERLFNQIAGSPGNNATPTLLADTDLLKLSIRIIGTGGLDTNATSILLTGLARFNFDESASHRLVDALRTGVEAITSRTFTHTWDAAFSILTQSIKKYANEATAVDTNTILVDYLGRTRGHETSPSALALLSVLVQAAPSSAEGAVAALKDSWVAGATQDVTRSLTTLEPLLHLIEDLSSDSVATLSAAIVDAGRPGAASELRQSTINALPLLQTSERGRDILDLLIQAHTPEISYSATPSRLEEVREGLAAIYSIYAPAASITTNLVNTYRGVMNYHPVNGVTALSTITWPSSHTGEVLSILASYPTQLAPNDLHGLIRQLARVDFELPAALRDPLREALIANVSSDSLEDREAASDVAAQLDIATAVAIALHATSSCHIVNQALTDESAPAYAAVDAYVQSLNSNPGLHGQSSADVAAAIQESAPRHSPDAIGDLAIDQVGGERKLAAAPWSDLLRSATPTLRQRISETLDDAIAGNEAKIRNVRPLSQGLLLAGVTWSDHRDHLLAALDEAVAGKTPHEERAGLLASILKVTPETRASALAIASRTYRNPAKKAAAAAVVRELNI